MGTINQKIMDDIIAGDYDDDNPTKIVSYNNMFDGSVTYALVCKHDYQMKYEESPACHNVRTIWTKERGVL